MKIIFKRFISLGLIFIILLTTSCIDSNTFEDDSEITEATEKESSSSVSVVEMTTVGSTGQSQTSQPDKEYDVDIPISSTFYSKTVLDTIEKNCTDLLEFKAMRQIAINAARKYLELDYDDLWNMIFDPDLERSWMVKSDGICPSCKQSVIMYDWVINPGTNPWKLQCPKCKEYFPKNDYESYYKSGLNNAGRFSHDLADKTLLYNAETGDKNDKFGVDDGTGYVQGGDTFRFIQTYLVYGQWKKTILNAIKSLSDAYIFTRDTEYGVRALILLDRLADFFPEYDYVKQGWLYEQIGTCAGYISYRIDSAFECYDLALAYDKVVEVIYMEPKLRDYLADKAKITGIDNKKLTFEDIKSNIDNRILKDIVNNQQKLNSNPPYTELAVFASLGVLNWPDNQILLEDQIANIINNNTKYDGMTGESGLLGYATMGKSAIAKLCNLFTLADPEFIEKMYNRCPKLYNAYRFHIDLHCVNKYYPILGDTGYFGSGVGIYPNSGGEENLMLYKLYELTGDKDLIRIIYNNSGQKATGSFKFFVELEDIQKNMRL